MTSITQSMLARFVAFGPTSEFTGADGLWFSELPENEILPFVVMVNGGETMDYTTEDEYMEMGTFDFNVFAVGLAETERLAFLVRDCYDPCIKSPRLLDFTGGKVIEFKRESVMTDISPTRNNAGEIVGQVAFTYSYTVQRSLP